jgi:hypothetical protein
MGGEADPGARQRKVVADSVDAAVQDAQPSSDDAGRKKRAKKGKKSDTQEVEYGNLWVDVLRVLSFLLFVSCGASYLVSGGESFFWSAKVPPKYLRMETWKGLLVCIQSPPPPNIFPCPSCSCPLT